METGNKATEHKATLVHCPLFRIISITVAAKATIIIETDRIKSVNPSMTFRGRDCLKSSIRKDEVRIERNVMTEVKAKMRESTSVMVKITKNGWLTRRG